MNVLNGWKTYIASVVTCVVLYATGDKVTAITQLGAVLTEIWPGLLMAGMRFITAKTSKV